MPRLLVTRHGPPWGANGEKGKTEEKGPALHSLVAPVPVCEPA